MFNIGMPELMVVFFVALLVFGPKRLPEIGRQLGKANIGPELTGYERGNIDFWLTAILTPSIEIREG